MCFAVLQSMQGLRGEVELGAAYVFQFQQLALQSVFLMCFLLIMHLQQSHALFVMCMYPKVPCVPIAGTYTCVFPDFTITAKELM